LRVRVKSRSSCTAAGGTKLERVKPCASRVIVAEIGDDMRRFPTQGHLLSWAGLCPRLDESNLLARSGAAAMLIPSTKPNRMVFTSAFGFFPAGPLPVVSVAKEDALLLRRFLPTGTVTVALDVGAGRARELALLDLPPRTTLAGFSLNPKGKAFATGMGLAPTTPGCSRGSRRPRASAIS
jgi:Transposase IS116/IS110/IS902 family